MEKRIILFLALIIVLYVLTGCSKKDGDGVHFTMKIGDEVTVTSTSRLNPIPWGAIEFPEIGIHPDGRIFVSWHMAEDIMEDYGTDRGWAVSKDGGETWEPFDIEEEPTVQAIMGTKLPNGEYMHYYMPTNTVVDEVTYEQLSKLTIGNFSEMIGEANKILVKDMPDGIIPKGPRYCVSKNKATEMEILESQVNFPGLYSSILIGRYDGTPQVVSPHTGLRRPTVAPDGTLWQANYQREYDEETGMLKNLFACYFFKSEDNGKSFELVSKIDSDMLDPEIYHLEGFCEPGLTFMPDGSMVVLMRTGSFSESYIARSTDGGKTWSTPVVFDYCGVEPQIHTFENGVTVASYGRPGLYIRATGDPAGMKWEDPVEIIAPAKGKDYAELEVNQNNLSCFNTDMVPINDHECLVVYSHVIDHDGEGGGIKTIKVRKITIEAKR